MHKQLTLEQRHYIYITRKKRQSMRSIVPSWVCPILPSADNKNSYLMSQYYV